VSEVPLYFSQPIYIPINLLVSINNHEFHLLKTSASTHAPVHQPSRLDQIDGLQTSELPCGTLRFRGSFHPFDRFEPGGNLFFTSGSQGIRRMVRASGLSALQGHIAHDKRVVQVIRASADAARSAVAQIADKAAATEVKFAKLDEFCRKRVCI